MAYVLHNVPGHIVWCYRSKTWTVYSATNLSRKSFRVFTSNIDKNENWLIQVTNPFAQLCEKKYNVTKYYKLMQTTGSVIWKLLFPVSKILLSVNTVSVSTAHESLNFSNCRSMCYCHMHPLTSIFYSSD